MSKRIICLFFILFTLLSSIYSKDKQLTLWSPDKGISVNINIENGIQYSIDVDQKTIIKRCKAQLLSSIHNDNLELKKIKQESKTEHIESPFYRTASFDVSYNSASFLFKNNLIVEFRVFNDGVAYRFLTHGMDGKEYIIQDEFAEYEFAEDFKSYIPYSTNPKKPEAMAFQATYDVNSLSKQDSNNLSFLPLTIDCSDSTHPELKITLMESDLESYPGMFIKSDKTSLKGHFAKYPSKFEYYPWRVQKYVTATEDYIAKCKGDRTFPWRIFAVSRHDTEMPVNNLVYALASPKRVNDISWIKPGLVAWDWWNDWGISGVDFKAGINMPTYKHYIDFASEYHLPYIILDEGWYNPKSGDMLTTIDDIDLEELVRYGKQKNVRIILWTVFNVLDKDLEKACEKYSAMGIAGFKVDFLDRDDQEAVDMIYRIADVCAKHKLMLDYHGIYKPTGINRTYPNIVNFESVFGMEEAKWTKHDEKDMPLYDVTFPFIRMQSGFVDFTPGGMRNATKSDFQPIYNNPLTMGTRCHQLAMYIVHDSPLTMLADNPTSYRREPEYTKFISSLPTVFDETKVLAGQMGEYIVTARRKGTTWYVGGQTNWNARDLTIDMSFLPSICSFHTIIYRDGINADKNACDYLKETATYSSADKISLHMASGGGFVMQLSEKK